ncbi:VWA domain-containing protein [Paenibacillus sp. MWE-103]|uniref:VWA domain-containing protein n=1 Tax=Paenibacillus artemisiicola TaxID=1172618 RepID=A0ABS3W8M3_9BACL|nr:VWA domain-containing protein [Paenibacillus artemisiicola]MBO7744669.1 VWA domain-containing protein [Paenibacillus artemisiicola]
MVNHRHAQEKRNGKGTDRGSASRASAAALLALALALGGCSSSSDDDGANSGNAAADNAGTNTGSSADSSADEGSSSPSESGKNGAVGDSSGSDEPASDGESGDSAAEPERGGGGRASQYDDAKPGQLTAGEWDDALAWKSWLRLMDGEEARESQSFWSMFPERRLEVDVTAGGKPVADAEVTLTGRDGEIVWEARTNNKGVAYAYPGLYDEQDRQAEFGVAVEAGQRQKRYENVPIPRGQALKVELGEAVQPPKALDLLLLVDTTGSMEDELNYLKTELKDVVRRVDRDNGQQLDIRVSANFYRDHGDEYVVKPYPFTDDIDKTVGQLSEQKAGGGGDFPEAVDEALANAIGKHEWSENARARLLFLVMDAPPHRDRKIVKRLQELTEDAAAEGIRIVPVASSGVDAHTEYLMRFMASATGGTYLFLTDHSGIGNDHMEPAVGEYEVKALNDLLVEVINRYAS